MEGMNKEASSSAWGEGAGQPPRQEGLHFCLKASPPAASPVRTLSLGILTQAPEGLLRLEAAARGEAGGRTPWGMTWHLEKCQMRGIHRNADGCKETSELVKKRKRMRYITRHGCESKTQAPSWQDLPPRFWSKASTECRWLLGGRH